MKYKNILTSIILTLVISLFVFPTTAVASTNVTTVRGNIYDLENGGKGIKDLTVSVTCNATTQNVVTNGNGLYIAQFKNKDCKKYQGVTSVVTYKSKSQTQTVYVSSNNRATLDFYYGSAVSVPEFGPIAGAIALVGSMGSYFALRLRKRV